MIEKKYITTIIVSIFILAAGAFYGYANVKENKTCVTSLSSTMETAEDEQNNLEHNQEKTQQTEEKSVVENKTVEEKTAQKQSDDTAEEKLSKNKICVHICGQVKKPGVYEFDTCARISDGIKLAGGFTKKAAADAINQAEFLEDGTQIYIPSITEINVSQTKIKQLEEKTQSKTSVSTDVKTSSKVNLNLATKEELMTLPGIGEAKANSIITYREEHGSFKSIEDIKNITGIKDGVFNSISDYITV